MKGRFHRRQRRIFEWISICAVMAGITIACFIPAIIFTLAYYILSPTGFWQKFVVFGVGAWFLGIFQVIGLVVCFIFWLYVLRI
jgi:hypothetical protein